MENIQLREESASLHEDYSKVHENVLYSDQQLKTLKVALSSCLSPSPAPALKCAQVEGTPKRVQGKLFGKDTNNDYDVLKCRIIKNFVRASTRPRDNGVLTSKFLWAFFARLGDHDDHITRCTRGPIIFVRHLYENIPTVITHTFKITIPASVLNKLPAHFNVQVKNDEIDIIYLIIKE